MKLCPNGHSYHPMLPECPLCKGQGIPPKVTMPAGGQGAVPPTQAMHGGGQAGGGGASPAPTQAMPGKSPGGAQPGGPGVGRGVSQPPPPTVGEWPGLKPDSKDKDAPASLDPIVGWLVAVKGPMTGQDFRIRWGQQKVGRDAHNPIQLKGDEKIARDAHFWIIYETEEAKFYLRPGDAKAPVFVRYTRENVQKKEIVLAPRELNRYDYIVLGDTELIFVPFAVEGVFRWFKAGESPPPPPPPQGENPNSTFR